MKSIARGSLAGLMVLLIASWSVPVCCMAMSTVPPAAMTGGHHHHHVSTNNSPSLHVLGAGGTQSCEATASLPSIALPAGNDLSLYPHAFVLATAQIQIVPTLQLGIVHPSTGPPGAPLASAFQAAPLRI